MENEIIEKIETILKWYSENSDKGHIETIMRAHDKLCLLSVNLAQIASGHKETYLRCYFNRKYLFSKKKLHYTNSGEKIGVSEEKANIDITNIKEEEIKSEALVDQCILVLRQVNKVISAMHQRVSFMKSELTNSKKPLNEV